MVVLNVTYHCKPGMREEFMEAIAENAIDLASRAEKGNYKYDFYRSVDHADDLLLVEKWENEGTLAVHRIQPHFNILTDLKEDYVDDKEIEQYIVD